jgi:integrase
MLEGRVWEVRPGVWAYRVSREKGGYRSGFRNKTEATKAKNEALDLLRARKEGRLPPRRDALTLRALVDEYLGQHVAQPNTLRVLADRLKYATDGVPVKPRSEKREGGLGDRLVDRIEARDVGEWRKRLPERSAWHITKALRQVLAYAVRQGIVATNVAAGGNVQNPRPPRREIRPFETWADVEKVDAELPERLRGLAIFACGTGLRPEEWIPLRARDFDLGAGVVIVRRTFTYGELRDSPEKGKGARRRVPLRSLVLDALRATGKVGPGVDPNALVFAEPRHGGMMSLDYFRRNYWIPAVENVPGLAEQTPYSMRHTYATHALAAGIGVFTLARRMGTSVEMIDETYGHLVADADRYERGLLDAYDARLAKSREIEIENAPTYEYGLTAGEV